MASISEGGTVLYPWSYVSSSSRSNNKDRFLSRFLVTKIPWSELYMIVVTLA
ncbi:unnamed protein product, partial [Fusarium graminearum]